MENSNIQQIEAYVRNQMNSDERRSFEEKMAGDPALREEVEETMIIVNGIRYAAHQDLRRMAEKARDTYHSKVKAKKPQRPWLVIAIVLVSAGLLWLGYLYFGESANTESIETPKEEMNFGVASESNTDNDDSLTIAEHEGERIIEQRPEVAPSPPQSTHLLALATEHLSTNFSEDFISGRTTSRQSKNPNDTLLSLAGEAFDNKNWQRSIELYEQVGDLPERSSAYAKLGAAYLQFNRPDEAIAVFRKLKEKSPIAEWREKGQWYLLLSYLAGGERYSKEFEAEINAALEDAAISGKMKDRFKILSARYNSLWQLSGMLFAGIMSEALDSWDTIPDWRKDTAYAIALLDQYKTQNVSGKEEIFLLKLDTAGKIFINTIGDFSEGYAKVLHGKAFLYQTLSELDTALTYYQQAINIRTKTGVQNTADAAMSYNNAGMCYYLLSDINHAIEFHEKALAIQLIVFDDKHIEVANSYSNLGLCFHSNSNFNKALELYQKALVIQLEILTENHQQTAKTYSNIGSIFRHKGDYQKAIETHKKALAIRLKIFNPTHPDVSASYVNLGNCYLNMGQYDQAIEFFEKALDIDSIESTDNPAVAGDYMGLGSCYYGKKDYNHAIEFYNKSLNIRLKNKPPNNFQIASTYFNLGATYFDSGNQNKAEEFYQKALNIWRQLFGENSLEVAMVYFNVGNSFFQDTNYEKALDYYQKSLNANSYNKDSLDLLLSQEHAVLTLDAIGLVYLKNDLELEKAVAVYKEVRDLLNYYRQSLMRAGSKEFLSDKFLFIFEASITANLLAYQETKNREYFNQTFHLADAGKALNLYESMKESDARHLGGIPSNLLDLEQQLQIDIAYHERKYFEQEVDSLITYWNTQVFDKRQQLDSLITFLEKEYPAYLRFKSELPVVNLDEVQSTLLNTNQTLIEYFTGDSSIFIFVVKKEDYQVIEVKKDFPLKEWVEQMREGIEVAGQKDPRDIDKIQGPEKYVTAAHQLYKKLIAPVAPYLTENVIIIPDAELSWLPFEALLTEKPDNHADFGSYKYLVRNHTFSYAPSATLLKEMLEEKSHRIKPDHLWLGLAPFSEQPSYPVLDSLFIHNNIASRGSVERLPHSGEEIAIISRITNGHAIYDTAASSEFFKQNASKYRILHLSQHAKAEKNIGDYSYLLFPDTLLYVRDIYNLQLNADMVVLSACETGYGELRRGEGIIGMTRAFTYAGAKSLFTTLWSVNDEATRDLTVNFYNHMMPEAGKLPKDEALREAKLSMIKGGGYYAHPYYWAGMIGIGDMRALDFKQ